MKINSKVKEADFKISDSVEIRYKKGYGFWIVKKYKDAFGDTWNAFFTKFQTIPLAIGFKEQYGFGFKDLKPFFFKTFDDAFNSIDKVDDFEYWEYNKDTHEKIMDTILRKGRLEEIISDFVDRKDEILDIISKNYDKNKE